MQDDDAAAIHVPVALLPTPLVPVSPLDELVHIMHVLLSIPAEVDPDHHSLEPLDNTPAENNDTSIVPELHMESHEDLICIPPGPFTFSEPEKLYVVFLFAKELEESEKKPNVTLQTPAPTLAGA